MDVLILFFIVLFSIILYYLNWRRKQMSILESNGIKGPKPHFVYGNIGQMHKLGNVLTHEKWKKKYGPIYGYYTGRHPIVVVSEPQLLKQIQLTEFKHFSNRFFSLKDGLHADPRNNDMLIRVKNRRWKELRSIMKQPFTASKLKKTIRIIDDTVNGLIDSIENIIDEGKDEFDIYVLFQGFTLETIGQSAFGIKTKAQTNPNDDFLLAAKSIFDLRLSSSLLATLSVCFPEFEFIVRPFRRLKELLFPSNTSYLMKMSATIVESRKANSYRRRDLLQSMLDAKVYLNDLSSIDESSLSINADMSADDKEHTEAVSDKNHIYKGMTNDEIVANTVLFLEAGYETTSTSLAFVMHILVNHRDVQQQVREEVMQLLKKDGKLNYNTVTQLPFMEAVIYETLRIYPSITLFVNRVADVNYKYEDITIPKGSCILVPLYQLHHDPRFWDEPEKFDPYRFYGDNRSTANDLIWQPFGAGPRNCIGMRFALCVMKLSLAKLLSKYRFEAGPRTEIGDITVRYKSIGMCPNHVFVKAVRLSV